MEKDISLQENQSTDYKVEMAILCLGVIEKVLTMMKKIGYRAQVWGALISVWNPPI